MKKKIKAVLKHPWFTIGIVIAIFVTAAVLLVVGIATHDEPGFVDESHAWREVPITVGCRGYVPEEDPSCETARSAVATFNQRVGFEFYRWTGGRDGAVVFVMRAPVDVTDPTDEPGGRFELTGAGETYEHCDVWVKNSSGPNDLEWLVAYHELGHCAGLEHDLYRLSIMYEEQAPTPPGEIPSWLSDYDRAILREKYYRR